MAAGSASIAAPSVSIAKDYPVPTPPAVTVLTPQPPPLPAGAPPAVPSERVIVPPRGTLAAGKWEAKPATIWIVVAIGTLLLLGWALLRVRRVVNERKRRLEALTRVRNVSSPS
jgi:hypothetical protein